MKRRAPDEIVHAPDETETIDLTSLLAEDFFSLEHDRLPDLSSSLLGKLFEALPLPALLLERSGHITFANTACARIHKDYQTILRKPFSRLFAQEKFRAHAVSLLDKVFNTRRPHTGEAVVAIRGSRIWARMSFRSIRIGKDRAALVLIEDLTYEKAEISQERKLTNELRQEIAGSFQAGAAGYLVKESMPEQLGEALRIVAEGGYFFERSLAAKEVERLKGLAPKGTGDDLSRYASLTSRQQEIVTLVAQGLSCKSIGERLSLSTRTVENHRARIMAKLSVGNTVELIRFAASIGLADTNL